MNSTLRNLPPVEGWGDRLPFDIWMRIWRLKVQSEREFWKNVGFILPDNPNVVVHAAYGVDVFPYSGSNGPIPIDWETAKSSLKHMATFLRHWLGHSVDNESRRKTFPPSLRSDGRLPKVQPANGPCGYVSRLRLSTMQTFHLNKPYRNVPVGIKRKRELEPVRARLCDELKDLYSLKPWPQWPANIHCPFPLHHPAWIPSEPHWVIDFSEP